MAAVSSKAVALLAAVMLALLVSAVAVRVVDREEEFALGSLAPGLAPAPAPAVHGAAAASAFAPGPWAVAALVSLLAFLAH